MFRQLGGWGVEGVGGGGGVNKAIKIHTVTRTCDIIFGKAIWNGILANSLIRKKEKTLFLRENVCYH